MYVIINRSMWLVFTHPDSGDPYRFDTEEEAAGFAEKLKLINYEVAAEEPEDLADFSD